MYNPERVPIIGPVIIAANHESYFDPPFIGSSLPRPINYLARENIFSHWLSGLFFRGLNAVPVDREGG
ncbi:MAG: lysophospholipid acyltransferase family protein, partial [Limisphaerales bacterium]